MCKRNECMRSRVRDQCEIERDKWMRCVYRNRERKIFNFCEAFLRRRSNLWLETIPLPDWMNGCNRNRGKWFEYILKYIEISIKQELWTKLIAALRLCSVVCDVCFKLHIWLHRPNIVGRICTQSSQFPWWVHSWEPKYKNSSFIFNKREMMCKCGSGGGGGRWKICVCAVYKWM